MLFIQTSHKNATRPQWQNPEYLNLVVRQGVSQNTGYAFFCERDFPRIYFGSKHDRGSVITEAHEKQILQIENGM